MSAKSAVFLKKEDPASASHSMSFNGKPKSIIFMEFHSSCRNRKWKESSEKVQNPNYSQAVSGHQHLENFIFFV